MPDLNARMSDADFRLIAGLILEYCGLHFPADRADALAARLAPRLTATQCASFQAYYHLLKYDNGREIASAVEYLTNHETYFFREAAQLEMIVQLVKQSDRRMRILSAGCSSGEEPYSLGMLLDGWGLADRADIVGVDISTRVLDKARGAAFTANSFRGVDERVIERYFTPHDAHLHLTPEMTRHVSFGRANLVDAAEIGEFGLFDVVLCRNVLIYFSRESKSRVIDALTGIMNPGGYLFLGHSESLFDMSHDLEIVRSGPVIAHRKPAGGRPFAPARVEVGLA